MPLPEPFYEHAGQTIYCGDCRVILPLLPKDSVDLLVTDPPYGIGWQSGRRKTPFPKMAGDDDTLDVPACLRQALRLLWRGRHVYVFGPCCLDGLPLGPVAELIWDKVIHGISSSTSPWAPQHERISFAVYTPSKANRAKGYGGLAARLRKGSVIRAQRPHGGVVRHPTEKPVLLLRQLIESSSIIGETVLDPFVGCGSTLVAAREEGRKAIGIEISEEYCKIAANRLAQDVFEWTE